MKNLVILISGRGSNMVAIADACAAQRWDARVAAVISNRAGASGLDYARDQHIASAVVDHCGYADRDAFDAALADAIDAYVPDLVLLAGFMRILNPTFVRRYAGRLMNIHPSLLPAFPGLDTHQRALDAGCKLAGATVHLVTPALDHGPIVAQAVVPVRADDTEATLSARVLAMEHVLYPRAVRWWVDGQIDQSHDGQIRIRSGESQLLIDNAVG